MKVTIKKSAREGKPYFDIEHDVDNKEDLEAMRDVYEDIEEVFSDFFKKGKTSKDEK